MENLMDKIKSNRSLVLGIFAALLIGIAIGSTISGGSIGGLKSNALGSDCNSTSEYCGDGTCNNGEDQMSCSSDCGSNTPSEYCGDGTCNNGEDQMSCSSDCGSPMEYGYCGDRTCNNGEDVMSCEQDCGSTNQYCGDGMCNNGEDQIGCPADCGSSETCTNGATNYPACDDNQCFNGATDYPDCTVSGCTDSDAYNYNSNATVNTGCEYCATEKGKIEEIKQDLEFAKTLASFHPGEYDQKIEELNNELNSAQGALQGCIASAGGY